MNFYRDFCRERLKDIEASLIEVASILEVEEDDELDAQQALVQLGMISANSNLATSLLGVMASAKVYKIGQTYQTIDAVAREDLELDAEGVTEVVVSTSDQTFAAFNPAPIGIGRGFSNPVCPRVVSRVPIKNIHRLGPPGLFNGCLFRNGTRSLFTCRTKDFPSTTYIYDVAEDVLFANARQLTLPPTFKYCSVEDVRMFDHLGSTFASFTLAGQTEKGWIAQMVMGEIDENLQLTRPSALLSPTQSIVEKNWVFFSHEGKLFCVYYPSPHVVYEVEMSSGQPSLGERWEADNWKAAGLMENARGGAPPVRVGDEFYHFYHTQHRHGRGVSYQVGLYTFEAKAPWNVKRVIKGPLLSMVPSKRELNVIFPVGAVFDGATWTLSCGIQDHETMAITLNFNDVDSLLTTVP